MEQSVYKIGEVSTRLGLADKNNNTLRSLVEEFGQFLSALANPAAGQPRRFTPRDVQVLAAIRDYRANHLSFEEIRERLRAGELDVTPPEPPLVDNGTGAQDAGQRGQALVPVAQLEALLTPLAASADEWRRLAEEYRQRLEGREARIETLERRIEELYARLDTTPQGPSPAPLTPSNIRVPAPYAPAEITGTAPYAAVGVETDASASRVASDSFPVASVGAPISANGNGRAPGSVSPETATTVPGNDGSALNSAPQEQSAEMARERDAVALFPLPVVDHHAGADQVGASGVPRVEGASRRRWWRPWA